LECRIASIIWVEFGSCLNTFRNEWVKDDNWIEPAEEIPIVPPSARIVYRRAVAFGYLSATFDFFNVLQMKSNETEITYHSFTIHPRNKSHYHQHLSSTLKFTVSMVYFRVHLGFKSHEEHWTMGQWDNGRMEGRKKERTKLTTQEN